MSSDPAISARGVGKCYRMFHTPGERIAEAITGRKRAKEFWALRDINFEIQPGESLGIIGRNGSGKSTLMQIIAGTLAPTTGEVHIRGRIAALLELGSGFNKQFTGRENVLLSGAILGVSRKEMERRLPEIEEFAEIGDFIDEPVGVYSSGMHARLAFAVSVSLQPDVLILDEILSVGDAGFQQRCIGRLHQLLASGVTLLFVSHAADAVKSICKKGLLLDKGRMEFFGAAGPAVNRYFGSLRQRQSAAAIRRYEELAAAAPVAEATDGEDSEAREAGAAVPDPERYGTGHARIESVRLLDVEGREREGFAFGDSVTVEVTARALVQLSRLDIIVRIRDKTGVDLFGVSLNEEGPRISRVSPGSAIRATVMFTNNLKAGPHGVCVSLIRPPEQIGAGVVTLDHSDAAAAFHSIPRGEKVIRGKFQHDCRVAWEQLPATSPTPVQG